MGEVLLELDEDLILRARKAARRITADIQKFIAVHTTTTTERTVARLFGIDGVDEDDVPLPNVVVENIQKDGGLGRGAAFWLGNAVHYFGYDVQQVSEAVARGSIDLCKVPVKAEDEARKVAEDLAREAAARIAARRAEREACVDRLGMGREPYLYVIVASGNIYEDVVQATAAVRQGADIIAVIRHTAQSLLDYVPYHATSGGFGGTYATQENFRIMRKALDEVAEEVHRYPRLVNYASGLCMPEIAAMGALERLDMMLNDSMYGILFRDINMKRTFIDQSFSRMINAFAGIVINTGEDNYLTTDDPVEAAHTVLASQFINEQFALRAGLPPKQIGLGHVFAIFPEVEDGLLYSLAQAQMTRQIFPDCLLKYMPPTKHITGNIFKSYAEHVMFNLVSVATGQGIQLLGMLTEAIHTPFLHDRFLAIDNAKYVFNFARHLGEEINYKKDGRVQRYTADILWRATTMLEEIQQIGLMTALERGLFARVKRPQTGGKGADGVVPKSPDYFNPFPRLMLPAELQDQFQGGEAE
ncbi:MAG TPA: lysine 5,6-aminomutase subunit alpha [Bacillota bacterium]